MFAQQDVNQASCHRLWQGAIMHEGLLHLYTGSGKGKTTAAVGLAARAAGNGCPVIFAQFLKDEPTGELASLKALGIPVLRSQKRLGFTFSMDEETRALCAAEQQSILAAVAEALTAAVGLAAMELEVVAVEPEVTAAPVAPAPAEERESGGSGPSGPRMLVVLDEVLDAVDLGFLGDDKLRAFVDHMPAGTELILTGRQAPAWLIDQANYHSAFRKIKHPYDQGIPARKSIEF
jgi:cob(I)alamin adenosyltransferase